MAKNHFSGVQNGSQSVEMGVLGGVFVLKSGLRILIQAPKSAIFCTPKMAKNSQNDPCRAFWGVPKMELQVPKSKF